MNKYIAMSIVCFLFAITGCKKIQTSEKEAPIKKSEDLVFIGEDNETLGYYKSSIIRANDNLRVWLHMPKADKESKKDIERLSELLAEISCNLHQIKIVKATDLQGKELPLSGDWKWDTPSPKSVFYRVIIEVCSEAK